MADFILPDPPNFNPTMRKIEREDLVHADLVNGMYEKLLENDVCLRQNLQGMEAGTTQNLEKLAEEFQGMQEKLEHIQDLGGIAVGGLDLSADALIPDATASFPTIQKTTGSEDLLLWEREIPDLLFGQYAILVRLKSSLITGTTSLVKLEAFSRTGEVDTLLTTASLKPTSFDAVNRYKTFGFNVDFQGSQTEVLEEEPVNPVPLPKLLVRATLLASATETTVQVDYLVISYSHTAIVAQGTV